MAVSLVKGQRISLKKEGGDGLRHIVMGLGWDAKKRGGFFGFGGTQQEIDLDATCVFFDHENNYVNVVYYGQLQSPDGSIKHTGDNRTGAGEGDDEQIIVDLTSVPATVKTLMFVVNSYAGHTFSEIENSFCRVVDQSTGKEIARYDLTCNGPHTALVMAKIYRHQGEWKMHAIGESAHGKTFADLGPDMAAHL